MIIELAAFVTIYLALGVLVSDKAIEMFYAIPEDAEDLEGSEMEDAAYFYYMMKFVFVLSWPAVLVEILFAWIQEWRNSPSE